MRFKAIFLILSVFVTLSESTSAFDGSYNEFERICREQWGNLPRDRWDGVTEDITGEAIFVNTSSIVGTQPRFALNKVRKSINAHLRRHGARRYRGTYRFQNNNRQSLYPARSAIEVVAYRGKFYVIDGHHRALTTVFTGSPTIPVIVKEDWSYKADGTERAFEEFAGMMETAKLVYSHGPHGEAKFYSLCDIQNDSNLYLARLITRTVKWDFKRNRLKNSQGEGHSFLILKINRGITRQEFEIADLLRKNGIVYDEKWGDVIPDDVLERIADILQRAPWAKKDPRVVIYKKPQKMADDRLAIEVNDHLETCETVLSSAK